jgi:hypothetical protein
MSLLIEPSSCLYFSSFLYRLDMYSKDELIDLFLPKTPHLVIYEHAECPMIPYYEKEMGAPLARFWFFGASLKKRNSLVALKKWATEVEIKHSDDDKRKLNLDVGYITCDQVILATGKPYGHRLYLDEGVYGELTFEFKDGRYHCLPWTYPDYAHKDVRETFAQARHYLLEKLKGL